MGMLTGMTDNFDLTQNSFCDAIPDELQTLIDATDGNFSIYAGNSLGTLCIPNPTSIPTPYPTGFPSVSPPPSNSPTSACSDSKTWHRKRFSWKNCSHWVSEYPQNRCSRMGEYGTTAFESCPRTCNGVNGYSG